MLLIYVLLSQEVFQIVVVSVNHKFATYQVLFEFFQSMHDGEHFLVMDLVVPLDCVEALRHECDRVPLALGIGLGDNGAGCKFGMRGPVAT